MTEVYVSRAPRAALSSSPTGTSFSFVAFVRVRAISPSLLTEPAVR